MTQKPLKSFDRPLIRVSLTIRINLPLFSTVVPSNINILDGTTVENKGKVILTEIFPPVQKHDIF